MCYIFDNVDVGEVDKTEGSNAVSVVEIVVPVVLLLLLVPLILVGIFLHRR